MASNPKALLRRIFPTARRKLVERSLRNIKGRYQNVLVIGAGSDPYKKNIKYTEQYITMDIDNKYNAINVVGDAQKLPFRDDSFDCVIAVELIEHINNPFILASEIRRTLSKGGTVYLTVPFMYHIHADPCDFWRPTKQGLQQIFKKYSEVDICTQGNRAHVLFDLVLTARYLKLILFPVRILSHFLVFFSPVKSKHRGSTAPSGFYLEAKK